MFKSSYIAVFNATDPRCSELEDARVILNVFITDGRKNSPSSKTVGNINDDMTCYQMCSAEYGVNCEYVR